jgi:SAM-dependent methyltransferase
MVEVDWDSRARDGVGYQSVIDPGDRSGLKNDLIDRIQWRQIRGWANRRKSVLDFGCGIGRFAARMGQLGVHYHGVDASLEMIEAARRLHRGGTAAFDHVAQLPLPFESGRFDGCLTVGVLQCLKAADGLALRNTIAELARVTAPGGELLMIEQASESGGFSGSVSESASERDYVNALSGSFEVGELRRVRLGALSTISSLFVRYGRWLPLRGVLANVLAGHEASRASQAMPQALQQQTYYDLCIVAVRSTPRGA